MISRWVFRLIICGSLLLGCNELPETTTIKQTGEHIGVLAYGSLILQPANPHNNVKLAINGEWQPLEIALPISLARLSSENQPTERATRVIDNLYGTPITVWCASSTLTTLAEAMENLAGREGALKIDNGYKLDHIFYIRKLDGMELPMPNEQKIPGTKNWAIKFAERNRQRLSRRTMDELAQWASKNGFTAIIWASFPPNKSMDEIKAHLRGRPQILKNTKNYINNLPQAMKRTRFELEILDMSE